MIKFIPYLEFEFEEKSLILNIRCKQQDTTVLISDISINKSDILYVRYLPKQNIFLSFATCWCQRG